MKERGSNEAHMNPVRNDLVPEQRADV
jgi:hypothetical protein